MPDALGRPLLRRIGTRRLLLEPQLVAHARQMFALLQDPAIYRYENEAPPSVQWLEERFRRLETRVSADGREQWLNWVVRLRGGELIGFVQTTIREDRSASIAYVFGSAHWGRGYASEAVNAMLGELGALHGIDTFFAVLKRHNAQSIRLLERLGFAHVPSDPGAAVDVVAHPLLADESLMRRSGIRTAACADPSAQTGMATATSAAHDCASNRDSP